MKRFQKRKTLKVLIYGLVSLGVATAALLVLSSSIPKSPVANTSAIVSARLLRNTTDRRIERIQERLEVLPSDGYGYVRLAGAYLQKARETGDTQYYARAEDSLLKALDIDSENFSAMTLMGTVALARHEFPEAMEWARRSIEVSPLNPNAYGVLGDAQVQLGQYEEAIQSVQTMVDLKPNLGSYTRIAYIRRLMGDVEGAIEVMQMAIDAASPGTEAAAWTRSQLGELYFNAGNVEEAAIHYEDAVSNFDNYYLALARLGKVRIAQGRYDEAIELFERAAKIIPQPVILVPLGDLYAKSGNLDKAQLQYDTVEFIAKLDAINQQIYNRNLSLFYSDHNLKLEEALELARAEIVVRKDIYGYDTLAWALFKNRQYDKAAEAIAEALKLGTQDASLYYHAGMIYDQQGDSELAREYLERALQSNPYFSVLQADEARRALANLDKVAMSSDTQGGMTR